MRNMSIGKQNFKETIDHQGTLYHYVDKSQLIEDVMSDDIIYIVDHVGLERH